MIDRNHIKPLLILMSISFLAQLPPAYVRYLGSVPYSTVVTFCCYALLYVFAEKRYGKLNPNMIVLAILFPVLAVHVPLRIASFQNTFITLPEFVLQVFAVVLARIGSLFKARSVRWIMLTGCAVLIAIGSFTLYKYWFNYKWYGAFSMNVLEKHDTVVQGKDRNGDVFSIGDQVDLWVLDFWNTSCGVCIRRFPDVQKLSDKYRDSKTVKVLAVNIPLKRDKENEAFELLESEGYDFENIIALDSSLHRKLGIGVFPTTLLLDKQGVIYFRGNIFTVDRRIQQILKQQ